MSRNPGSIPGRGKRYFWPPKRPDRIGDPPDFLFNGHLGIFLEFSRLDFEIDYSVVCTGFNIRGALPPLPNLHVLPSQGQLYFTIRYVTLLYFMWFWYANKPRLVCSTNGAF